MIKKHDLLMPTVSGLICGWCLGMALNYLFPLDIANDPRYRAIEAELKLAKQEIRALTIELKVERMK